MRFLAFAGRHAAVVMLGGMVIVAALPGVSALLRPWLPMLVSLVLALGIARLNLRAVAADLRNPRRIGALLGLTLGFVPLSCLGMVTVARLLGAGPDVVLAVAVFGAAPPISSATSLALLMGYDARLTLQLSLLATLSLPVLGPLSLSLVGIETDLAVVTVAARIAAMIAGGFVIGLALQRLIGKARIDAHPQEFNGVAALAMILFLFPLFDGVSGFIVAHPGPSLGLLALALALNIVSHIIVARLAGARISAPSAHALGLMYGNRNISFYLAVLPANPALGVFVAAAQIPIYATPALFKRRQ